MIQETYSAAANPEISETSELHVLFAGESQTVNNHRLGPKVYDYYLLHYVEEGQGSFQTEYAQYDLQAGDCFLILPEQLVSYASDPEKPWRYRWIAFAGVQANLLIERAGFTARTAVCSPGTESSIPSLLEQVLQTFRSKNQTPISPRSAVSISSWQKQSNRSCKQVSFRQVNRAFKEL